jgi:dihydroflavonol-4-reductase
MIAITGATGLIGSHLTYALLKQNKLVLALTTKVENVDKIKAVFAYYGDDYEEYKHLLQIEICDVLDVWQLESLFVGVKIIYHCAGFVSFKREDKERLFKLNAEGTANVVNAAMASGVTFFCHFSSVAALNNPDVRKQINESIVWKQSPNQSQYAISKYYAEREVWRAFEEGLQGSIIQPSIVLGPINSYQSSAQIILQAKKRMKFFTSGASGFVDVRDLVKVAITITDKEVKKQNFIVNGFNSSYKDLFSLLNKQFGHSPPEIGVAKWALKIIAIAFRMINKIFANVPYISKEHIDSAYEIVSYDNSKVKKELGIDFRDMKETIEWLASKG